MERKLGEQKWLHVNDELHIIRVPAGWLYCVNKQGGNLAVTLVTVQEVTEDPDLWPELEDDATDSEPA